jgi:helix-turn-helix protein
MSHQAVDLAFPVALPHLQKHVLMALAYRHNHLTNRCDPAIETIAQDCGMSKSSVKASLRALQTLGLIEAIQRKDGRVHISNFYKLNFITQVGQDTTGVGQDTPHPGQNTTGDGAPDDPGVGQDTPPKGEVESGNERKTTADAVEFILPDWIDPEAWSGYLEVRKKKRAVMSSRALNGVVDRLFDFRSRGHNPDEILATSLRSNWTDVYEPRTSNGGINGAASANFRNASKTAGNLNAAESAFALLDAREANRADVDEVQPPAGRRSDPGDPGAVRGRLIDLRTG